MGVFMRVITNNYICIKKTILLSLLLLCFLTSTAYASENHKQNGAYQTESVQHTVSSQYAVKQFDFGQSIGTFIIDGNINSQTKYNGYTAYSTNESLRFQYIYDGSYQTKEKEQWNIVSDSCKEVNGIVLHQKIDSGVLIIQKSYDGINWFNTIEPICDYFASKKVDRTNLYTVSDEEIKIGTFFRVLVAYEMGRKTGEKSLDITELQLPSDVYTFRYCTEVYEFFIYSAKDNVIARDLMSGNNIRSGTTVQSGFIIDKNGSSNRVEVNKNGTSIYCDSLTTFCEPGIYNIISKDPLGKAYSYNITVKEGLQTASLNPIVYESKKNKEYSLENPVTGIGTMGIPSHTVLTLAHNSSRPIKQSVYNGFPAYGITGNEVSFLLKLQNNDVISQSGWTISSDSWGKKTSQTICGAHTGQVDSGALIVQTSSDGKTWKNIELNRYSNGLFTTDYEEHYGKQGDVLIYTPKGEDIKNGVYIRVLYAFASVQTSTKTDLRCLEKYDFYLCSDELAAVVFHNTSVKGQMKEICEDYDNVQAEMFMSAETMLSGSYTVNGFQIDNSLNPTVKYRVKKDGNLVSNTSPRVFSSTGKYEIELTSAVNSTKSVTIYVDRMSQKDSLAYYFGNAFITGKRIYSDGDLPVFEGGVTSYNISAIDNNHVPISGEIKNITTGESIRIAETRGAKRGVLSTPGIYLAQLTTNPNFGKDNTSGDCKTFTFRFEIIPYGTAPGPIVNQNSLKDYSHQSVSDSRPKYYGLTYPSASTGYITLAFATKEAALEYAYNYEKGMVEKQKDGSYRYIGSFIVSQKEKYNSEWDLTDAVYYFAEQAIHTGYFDLSNEFTVLTLDDQVIENNKNLRTLELARSITLFANDQKAELTDIEALPIINDKPYNYLTPGKSGLIKQGTTSYQFIKDKYECDSSEVTITDCNGGEYSIKYGQSVGKQLEAKKCPSGIVNILESTVYGDSATYKAVYIANGDNTSEIVIDCHDENGDNKKTFTQKDDGTVIEVEAFSIADIRDELDPYAFIVVSDSHGEEFCSNDTLGLHVWSDPGDYQIKVVNRLGYSYVINVKVTESNYATIRFTGEGTEDTQDILTNYGAKDIELPVISRYGYNLVGFEDESGFLYNDKIEDVTFRGSVVLNAVWRAKQYTVALQNSDGSPISTMIVDFGKEYELPTPELKDGASFHGWKYDGNYIDSNILLINSEGNISLIADVVQPEIVEDNSKSASAYANNEKKKTSGSVVILVVFIFMLLAAGLYYIRNNSKL